MTKSNALSVLVVDRNAQVAAQIVEKLRGHGFLCEHEEDPAKIAERAREKNWTAVLVDSVFDDISPLEVCTQLRTLCGGRTEILLMSPHAPSSLYDLHQAGANASLEKPVRVEDLLEHLRHRGLFSHDPQRPPIRRHFAQETFRDRLAALQASSKKPLRVRTELSNLGRGGFFLEVPAGKTLPEVGQLVEFELKMGMVPDTKLLGRGVVRWVHIDEELAGVGIEFLLLPEDSERFVDSFSDLFKVQEYVPRSA